MRKKNKLFSSINMPLYCIYLHMVFATPTASTARYSNHMQVCKLTTTDSERQYIHRQTTAPYPTFLFHGKKYSNFRFTSLTCSFVTILWMVLAFKTLCIKKIKISYNRRATVQSKKGNNSIIIMKTRVTPLINHQEAEKVGIVSMSFMLNDKFQKRQFW